MGLMKHCQRSKFRHNRRQSQAPGLVPQHAPEQLPTRILRDGIDELHPSGQLLVSDLVVCNVLPNKSEQGQQWRLTSEMK